jgi:hypothetical protein
MRITSYEDQNIRLRQSFTVNPISVEVVTAIQCMEFSAQEEPRGRYRRVGTESSQSGLNVAGLAFRCFYTKMILMLLLRMWNKVS